MPKLVNPAKNRTFGALVHDVVMYDFVRMRRAQFAARNMKKSAHLILFTLLVALSGLQSASAQTAFTYQGKLIDDCCPATGYYDLTFKLFDNAGPGTSGFSRLREALSTMSAKLTMALSFVCGFGPL